MTGRKDDAADTDQAAIANIVGLGSSFGGGTFLKTIPGLRQKRKERYQRRGFR